MIQFFVLLLLCGSGVQSAASLCRFVCFPSFSTVLLPDLKLCFDAFMQAHILLGWGKYKEPQYHQYNSRVNTYTHFFVTQPVGQQGLSVRGDVCCLCFLALLSTSKDSPCICPYTMSSHKYCTSVYSYPLLSLFPLSVSSQIESCGLHSFKSSVTFVKLLYPRGFCVLLRVFHVFYFHFPDLLKSWEAV